VVGIKPARDGVGKVLALGSRAVLRLSGTGTAGATLRIYIERYRDDAGVSDIEEVLGSLKQGIREMLRLRERFGTDEPTVVT
jgi:phosphoglucomutase